MTAPYETYPLQQMQKERGRGLYHPPDPNGQSSHNEGLCLKCARELNIRPVTDMIEKMGLSDEELEGLTNEMMSAFDGTESMQDLIGNITESLRDVAGERDDD